MRILLTGRNGQVGWELERSLQPLGEIIAVGRAECDLAKPAQVREVIRTARPDLIVNAAAYTAVDKAESEPALAQAINGDAPGLMAEEAKRLGAALIHYSTDYVFDGRKSAPYVETDATNPLSVYGRTKLAGEQAIAASGAAHVILRTSWVYAARGKNFVRTILRLARERETLEVVGDQWGAPTWARTIAEATATLIGRAGLDGHGVAGPLSELRSTFHLTATGATTWFGFANAVVEAVPDPARRLRLLVPIPSSAYQANASRPANSRLDCSRFIQDWHVQLPAWRVALAECVSDTDLTFN